MLSCSTSHLLSHRIAFFAAADAEAGKGVKPLGDNIKGIPKELEGWNRHPFPHEPTGYRRTTTAGELGRASTGGLGHHHRARSFVETPDGRLSALSESPPTDRDALPRCPRAAP